MDNYKITIDYNFPTLQFPRSRPESHRKTGQVTGQVEKLIECLDKEMSKKEIMEKLNLKGRDNFEKLYLNPAIEKGLIELTIPDKPNSRLQKYRVVKVFRDDD